jgi:hypothetical protein
MQKYSNIVKNNLKSFIQNMEKTPQLMLKIQRETLFAALPLLKRVNMRLTDDARPGRNDRWITVFM